jgi:hypothetical protein
MATKKPRTDIVHRLFDIFKQADGDDFLQQKETQPLSYERWPATQAHIKSLDGNAANILPSVGLYTRLQKLTLRFDGQSRYLQAWGKLADTITHVCIDLDEKRLRPVNMCIVQLVERLQLPDNTTTLEIRVADFSSCQPLLHHDRLKSIKHLILVCRRSLGMEAGLLAAVSNLTSLESLSVSDGYEWTHQGIRLGGEILRATRHLKALEVRMEVELEDLDAIDFPPGHVKFRALGSNTIGALPRLLRHSNQYAKKWAFAALMYYETSTFMPLELRDTCKF